MTDKTPTAKQGKKLQRKESAKSTQQKLTTKSSKIDHKGTKKDKETNTKQSIGKKINWWAVVAALSVLNLVAVSYLWFVNQQQQQQKVAIEKQNQQQLDQITQDIQQQQTTIEKLSKHKHQQLEEVQQKIENLGRLSLTMQSQLNLTQQQVNQAGKGISQDVVLAEADFLIRTAAIRLLLTENISETTNLLKAADKKLIKVNDVAIFPVRAALTKDLYQLKSTKQVDVIGSYLILENIEKSLAGIKINFILPEKQEKDERPTKTQGDWYQHLSNSTEEVINDWFQVTHYDEEIKPLVSRQQDILIKQSIVLLIKQAQWALIQKNMELYQLTLKNLSQKIASTFNKQDPVVKASLVEIKSLLMESIVTPIEKYLDSEKAMKTYLDAKTKSENP